MKQGQSNTKVAGVDVGKGKLDVAVHGEDELLQTDNAPSDFDKLERWLKGHGVSRVGLEATGGYEKKVAAFLVAQGFEVIVHQPMEVRLYGRLTRQRAKNDKADAILIAAFTASLGKIKAPADPKLAPLAERFCVYEQVTDQIAKLKTFLEHVTLKDILRRLKAQIRSLETLKTALAREIDQAIKADPAMLERYRLLLSIPVLLGHPDYPMSIAQHDAKLANACATAAVPVDAAMIAADIARLETMADVALLSRRAAGL